MRSALCLLLAAAAVWTPARGDEMDRLVETLRPPARFQGYRPNFRAEERRFVFHQVQGPEEKTFRVVRDGEKFVGLVRSGDVLLLALTPDQARTTLDLPTGRLHLDNLPGPSLPTHQFIQAQAGYTVTGEGGTDAWEGGGETLTLVRRFRSDRHEVLSRFLFRVDPVLGYMVVGTQEVAFTQLPEAKERKFTAGTFCPGCYVPWPDQWTYDRTVYTPAGTTDWLGWANNLIAMDRADARRDRFTWRPDGFIAYLNRTTGWSVVRTRCATGGAPTMSLCNAHNDFHIAIPFPDPLEPGADGRVRLRFVHRLFAAPPEVTRHLWDRMTLLDVGREAVIIRVGVREDFEDQPVDLSQPVRGLCWTSGGPTLSTRHAFSGRRSLAVKGRAWPNLPQVSLQPNTRYRLEAMMMAEDPGVRLYVAGDFYEWSPHTGEMLVRQKTNVVEGGSGWRKAVLEFTTPAWDPFINIAFHADGGEGYVDDFCLRKAEAGP